MYNPHHDEIQGRVRHVPIQIESRNVKTTSDENQAPRRFQKDEQSIAEQYYNQSRDSNTLPNTSSVNIDYRPSALNRHHQRHQQQHSSNQTEHEEDSRFSSTDRVRRHTSKADQSADSRASSGSPIESTKANSDKLVGSPKPIPLPLPKQFGNCGGKADTSPDMDEFVKHGSSTDSTLPTHQGRRETQQQHHHQEQQDHQQAQQQYHEPPNEQRPKQPQQNQNPSPNPRPNNLAISSIKVEIAAILEEIDKFEGDSQKTKEYRFLDEMLTRCVLNLDRIECGGSQEMRQQRKAAIKLVDCATEILQKKQQLNLDTSNLSKRKEQLDCDIKNLSKNITS